MNEEVIVKAVDFSLLPVGERFFVSKQTAQLNQVSFVKTESAKTLSGGWSNAKNAFGTPNFVKYDARVWVRK